VVVKIEIYNNKRDRERVKEREGSAKPKTGIVQINLDKSRGPGFFLLLWLVFRQEANLRWRFCQITSWEILFIFDHYEGNCPQRR